jgi:hypothetical protein
MITDHSKTQYWLDNGLKHILEYVKNSGHSNQILAFELFNEPEWMIEGGAGV